MVRRLQIKVARQTLLMCICANSDPFSLACARLKICHAAAELRQLADQSTHSGRKTGSNFQPPVLHLRQGMSDLWRGADQFICDRIARERILVLIMRPRNALMHHMGVHTVAPALNHATGHRRIKTG